MYRCIFWLIFKYIHTHKRIAIHTCVRSKSLAHLMSGYAVSSGSLNMRSMWCAPFGIRIASTLSDKLVSTPPPCQGSSNPLLNT